MSERGDFAPTSWAGHYVADLRQALASLDVEALDAATALVRSRFDAGHAVFLVGNGGSAAVADHMACDWRLAASHVGLKPRAVVSLTENTAIVTAIANDSSYEAVFQQQLEERAQMGDLLVCLSVSGESRNIVRAAEAATRCGVSVLSLVGRQSTLAAMSNHAVILDSHGDYGLSEDLQSAFLHMVARSLRGVPSHRAVAGMTWNES